MIELGVQIAQRNSYLCTDATGHCFRTSPEFNGRKAYIYTILIRSPTTDNSPHVSATVCEIITTNHTADNLTTLYKAIFNEMRKANHGKQPEFSYCVTDNSDTLRYVLSQILHSTTTHNVLDTASTIAAGRASFATAKTFTPLIGCIAHHAKSESDFFKKLPPLQREAKDLFMSCRLATLQLTKLSKVCMLNERLYALSGRQYWTSSAQREYQEILQILGIVPNNCPWDFVTEQVR